MKDLSCVPKAEEWNKNIEDDSSRDCFDAGERKGPGPELAIDVLYDGKEVTLIQGPRVRTCNSHGTGCTTASCIAAEMAKGLSPPEAVRVAKRYITDALLHSRGLTLGSGKQRPLNHGFDPRSCRGPSHFYAPRFPPPPPFSLSLSNIIQIPLR